MQKIPACLLLLLTLTLTGCIGEVSVEQFYRGYFNLETVPDSVSDFHGESFDMMPAYLSHGYFQYTARPEYFEMLAQHVAFREESELNQAIHRTECSTLPGDFSYWTDEKITTSNKECYEGIFDFTRHLILYDPATAQVQHFVDGIRD